MKNTNLAETKVVSVEGVCSKCGIGMSVKMKEDYYADYLKYDGEVECYECLVSDPELTKKERAKLLKTPNVYVVTMYRPYEKENHIGEQPLDYQSYLNSAWWKAQREKALERATYRCQLCNNPDDVLQVHHRTYERLGEELPEDLTVLCKSCHYWFHKSKHKF